MSDETITAAPPPTAPPPPPPLPPIDGILHKDVVQLIKSQPENLLVRGMIRQMLNLAVPKEFFIAGGSEQIIQFIQQWEAKRQAAPPPVKPLKAIPMPLEFEVDVNGTSTWTRRDRYHGTIELPIEVIREACESDEDPDTFIFNWVGENWRDIMNGHFGRPDYTAGPAYYEDMRDDDDGENFHRIRRVDIDQVIAIYRQQLKTMKETNETD